MQPTQAQLDELVQRIVATVRPVRIILFGSAARGEMTTDSDVDVLVVMPEGTPQRRTAQELHRHFIGLPFPVDVIVATPSQLQRHRENIGLIYRTILDEGRELYAA
jgi:predicted nucleotidyltransferase